MMPPIDEDGKVKKSWLVNMANHTLVSFHSKSVTTDADGNIKAVGSLTVTRVDRNVELTPNESLCRTRLRSPRHSPHFA